MKNLKLNIRQCNKAKTGWTPEKRKVARLAVAFAVENIPGLSDVPLSVTLRYVHHEHYAGSVVPTKDKPGFFCLALSGHASLEHLATTVLHEMVHVKQYALEGLKQTVPEFGVVHSAWKGEEWLSNEDGDFWSYYSPWEREARKKAKQLARKFRKQLLPFLAKNS